MSDDDEKAIPIESLSNAKRAVRNAPSGLSSAADILGRLMAQCLSEWPGQSLIVENVGAYLGLVI
jgi:hypothetical protein